MGNNIHQEYLGIQALGHKSQLLLYFLAHEAFSEDLYFYSAKKICCNFYSAKKICYNIYLPVPPFHPLQSQHEFL